MKKIIAGMVGLIVAVSCFAGQLTYTTEQVENAVRLTIEPGHLAAQLPETNSPIVTAYTVADSPTNLTGVAQLTLVAAQDFTFDAGNTRFYYSKSGATNVAFNVKASLSFSQAAASAEVIVRATKNGIAIDGVYFRRTIGNASTIGVGYLAGHFTLSENDYIEISVESNKSGDFSSWSFSTEIVEEGQ